MLHVAFLAMVVTAVAADDGSGPSVADRRIYEALRLKAGQEPAALVKLALWCEAHGLSAERRKHLADAVAIEPGNVAARGLLGLISYRGKWLSPDDVQVQRKSDVELSKKLEAYYPRRAEIELSDMAGKSDAGARHKAALAHEKLGAWCQEQGLKDEAIAHFTTALQLDPYLDAAWKRLGYVKHHGHWLTHERIAAEEQELAAQHKADRHWEPLLRKWKAELADKRHRRRAEKSLDDVTDPRSVPAIKRVFAGGSEDDQSLAISMLTKIDGPGATKELAALAVFSESAKVRETATTALKERERRDYVTLLIDLVKFPARYQVQPIKGPGSRGGLLIETPRIKMLRKYDAPAPFKLGSSFHGTVVYDPDGMPVPIRGIELDSMSSLKPAKQIARQVQIEERARELMAEANLKAAAAQQQLTADVAALEQFNSQAAALNERVLPVLQEAAGAPASDANPDVLNKWWYDRLGYSYEAPQQIQVTQTYQQIPPPRITTCFAAGTPVRTIEGLQPIESIRTGDLVLSQDVTTGELDFHMILRVHHNPPNQTLRITLSDKQVLVASVYHRFWRGQRLGAGPRAEPWRRGACARKYAACRYCGRRGGRAALQSRRRTEPQFLRRQQQRLGPRQHAAACAAGCLRQAAQRRRRVTRQQLTLFPAGPISCTGMASATQDRSAPVYRRLRRCCFPPALVQETLVQLRVP